MNDWYNDPPETPDPPYCCDDEMNYHGEGKFICQHCLAEFIQPQDPQPDPAYDTIEEKEQAYGEPIQPALCPHGNEWGECDKCDYDGDLAYDAARERGR